MRELDETRPLLGGATTPEALDSIAASLFARLAGYEEKQCTLFIIIILIVWNSESRVWFTYRGYALYKVAKSFQT